MDEEELVAMDSSIFTYFFFGFRCQLFAVTYLLDIDPASMDLE